jgi:hypothetical protein
MTKPKETPPMKYVHDTRRIAHLWMHKEQAHARNAQANFYFRDSTIYSYGSHFPIASHARTNAGEQCVIMTTRTYGPTTTKHLHLVRRAIPDNVPVFYAPWPLLATGTHEQNIASLRKDVIQRPAHPSRRPQETPQHCQSSARTREGHQQRRPVL